MIEQFPEDPESPGKPKVRLFKSPSQHSLMCRVVPAQIAAASYGRLPAGCSYVIGLLDLVCETQRLGSRS